MLPNVAGGALRGVAVDGVLAIHIHHKKRDGIHLVAGGNDVEMVGHQRVSRDPDLALLAAAFEQSEKVLAISVAGEYGLLIIAALGEVKPVSGRGKAKSASHVCASVE